MSSISSSSSSSSSSIFAPPASKKRPRAPDLKPVKPHKIQVLMDSAFTDDRELWIRSAAIQDLAKRLLDNPNSLKFPGDSAKTFLALIYGAAYYDQFLKTRNFPSKELLIETASKVRDTLEIKERIRLFKVLPLMDDEKDADFGRRMRQAAYPILYKNVDTTQFDGGPSVKNILNEALELVDGLLKNQDWTDDIALLKSFPINERLDVLREWKDSVIQRLNLLKGGYEVQLSKYKLNYQSVQANNSYGLIPTFSSHYSDIVSNSLTFYFSQAIEGFAAQNQSSEICHNATGMVYYDIGCGTCASCIHNSTCVELLMDWANIKFFSSNSAFEKPFFTKATYISKINNIDPTQQETLKKLSTLFPREAVAFQNSAASHQLEKLYLEGRQPHFIPKHWPLLDKFSLIKPKVIPSWSELAAEKEKQLEAKLLMQNQYQQSSTSTHDEPSSPLNSLLIRSYEGNAWTEKHSGGDPFVENFVSLGSPCWESVFDSEGSSSPSMTSSYQLL